MINDHEANAIVCTCQKAIGRKSEKSSSHQSFNCGDRCINRVVSTECCSWTCPSGNYCRNRRFQLHQDAYVYPIKTEKKGWGLFAGEFIPKGTFIMQYAGEVFSVDSELGQERVKMYRHSTCTYLMMTTNNEVIDPTFVGNIARLINHSCDPNCETQKWNVLGEVCVGIFAVKDIQENEELSFDYQFDFFKTPFTKCYCGTSKCKGYLGVLATTTLGSELPSISAPACSYCKQFIIDKESLIVCKGTGKETFHIQCVIKKEGGNNKKRAQAFAMNLDKRTFVCRSCKTLDKKRMKNLALPAQSSLKRIQSGIMSNLKQLSNMELDQDIGQGEPSLAKVQSERPEITGLEIDIVDENINHLPWESKDPNVRKYFEDNAENQMLDQIIACEFYQIEAEMRERMQKEQAAGAYLNMKRLRKLAKTGSEFSEFYNFMSELAKRLKSRIKQNKALGKDVGYKFRRQKELVLSSAKYPRRKKKPDTPKQKSALEDQTQVDKMQLEAQNENLKQNSTGARTLRQAREQLKEKTDSTQKQLEIVVKDSQESLVVSLQSEDIEKPTDSFQEKNDDEEMEVANNQNNVHITSKLQGLGFLNEQESASEDQSQWEEVKMIDIDIEGEQDEQQDEECEEEDEEELEEELEEEIDQNDSIEESSDSEQTESENQSSFEDEDDDKELKLEDLQESDEEANDEGDTNMKLSEAIKDQLMANISGSSKLQPVNNKFISPRKNSIIHQTVSSSGNNHIQIHHLIQTEAQKEREALKTLAAQKIQAFVKEQIYLKQTKLEDSNEVRESKLNLYEPVFNTCVPDFIDDYQCLPNFQIYWDQAWGGMVTVRIISTYKQFNWFTMMMQEFTDLLFKSKLLNGRSEQHSLSNGVPIQVPFEIVVVHVPKNFIRKLVGYQEKSLTHFRKNFNVDFDYCKDLLNDEVFNLNENTQLRIFGNAFDVRRVNECIQHELEQIKMKTIFLQMNDCKIIMDHVKEVKVHVDPCEIRIKKMTRDWKDLRHPFYYLPNYFREMVLIGNQKEIDDAERMLERFLQVKRQLVKVNMQQISYLLPLQFQKEYERIKQEVLRISNNHIQIFFYEPTYPRKHITVLMIGDWKMLLDAKKILETEVNNLLSRSKSEMNFESFQRFTYHQQIRFSFKSLKRFVLEKDINYLNHWDMVSIFVENARKRLEEDQKMHHQIHKASSSSLSFSGGLDSLQQKQILPELQLKILEEDERDIKSFIHFIKNEDKETCINALFVLTNSEPQKLEQLMNSLMISKREIVKYLAHELCRNREEVRDFLKYHQRSFKNSDFQFKQKFFTSSSFPSFLPVPSAPTKLHRSSRSRSISPGQISYSRGHASHNSHSRSKKPLDKHYKNESKSYYHREPVYDRSRSHSRIRRSSRSSSAKRHELDHHRSSYHNRSRYHYSKYYDRHYRRTSNSHHRRSKHSRSPSHQLKKKRSPSRSQEERKMTFENAWPQVMNESPLNEQFEHRGADLQHFNKGSIQNFDHTLTSEQDFHGSRYQQYMTRQQQDLEYSKFRHSRRSRSREKRPSPHHHSTTRHHEKHSPSKSHHKSSWYHKNIREGSDRPRAINSSSRSSDRSSFTLHHAQKHQIKERSYSRERYHPSIYYERERSSRHHNRHGSPSRRSHERSPHHTHKRYHRSSRERSSYYHHRHERRSRSRSHSYQHHHRGSHHHHHKSNSKRRYRRSSSSQERYEKAAHFMGSSAAARVAESYHFSSAGLDYHRQRDSGVGGEDFSRYHHHSRGQSQFAQHGSYQNQFSSSRPNLHPSSRVPGGPYQ